MKLGNSTVTGIFQFITGSNIIYSTGDLILYNYNLYYVKSDYSGELPPDEEVKVTNRASAIETYVHHFAYGVNNKSDDALITAANLQLIIRSYFRGLKGNGDIENISLKSFDELFKNYTSTGAYHLIISEDTSTIKNPDDTEITLPVGEYLLRVYSYSNESKSANNIYYECIDFNNGYIYLIKYINHEVTISQIFPQNKLKEASKSINTYLTSIINKCRTKWNEAKAALKSALVLQQVNFIKTATGYEISTELQSNPTLHLIFQSVTSNPDKQQFKLSFALNTLDVVYQMLKDPDTVKLNRTTSDTSKTKLILTLSSPNLYELKSAYIGNSNID